MAITDKEQGVWGLDQVYNKINQGSIWEYNGEQQLFMAGRNIYGNLGQNARTNRSSPVQVPGNTWKTICVPSDFRGNHATKTDGTLWWWGDTDNASSGTNQKVSMSSPTQIPGTTWDSLAASTESSICTKTDGSLWVWGYGRYGQMANNDSGPGSSKNRSSPIQVGTETTWSGSVVSGYLAHGGVKTDGTMWFWGHNNKGIFGTNNTTEYSSPTQLPGTDWSTTQGQFAMSYSATLAIKTDGTLWAWGDNDYGQLGQGQPDNDHRSSPVQVPGTNWSYVASGVQSMFAVNTSGELYSWGWGDYGVNGQNNRTEYRSPEKVGNGTDWVKVFASHETSIGGAAAIKADGSMYVWGRNEYGQTGRNDTVNWISSPTQVPGTWLMASPNSEIGGYIAEL